METEEKLIAQTETEEKVILQSKTKELPKSILIIFIINFIYLVYCIVIDLVLAPLIDNKFLLYLSIFTSVAGIISNFGLLAMKRWSLYAYSLVVAINLIISIKLNSLHFISMIATTIALIVIWDNYDKMSGIKINVKWKKNQENSDNNLALQNGFAQKLIKYLVEKGNKIVVAILSMWTFLHTYLIIKSQNESMDIQGIKMTLDGQRLFPNNAFYPFSSNFYSDTFNVAYYDFSEYFVYVGGAWLIFFLFKYFQKK